ncbi:integration host factor subunit beta [Allochromatium vinosum]|uniref:Integration host factor subunit beta n=1 Tax=Allochromatium vinosum (strain ATCC 17899 / DSM 180 / NBRC 103801 / NCIMB 10441 / D) TaxID=572477 RepID=D3RWE6_ALLVD|nr:integration host factor subunit beta [Allochromatium vinosum]ADC64158.1 integration host factor, beta subunit [Allochromatium vinosum DSM 180]
MTRSELITQMANRQEHLPEADVEVVVKALLNLLRESLANGERIEVRGFGSFSLHYRPPRQARNPKTGETVFTAGKHYLHFKPGKELRERVNFVYF